MKAGSLELWAERYARIALGAAFLSAVASRFGLWGHNNWANFVEYTAEVNAFLPRSAAPFLACAATACELTCGLGLISGFRVRWFALGAAVLLALFGTAMAISGGIKSPLDYSVYSASSCALLLFLRTRASSAAGERREATPEGHRNPA